MSAQIRLASPDENAGHPLLGYNTATGGCYSAGLGGYGRAYVIDEHAPGLGWQAVKHEGRVSQLQPSTAYDVEVDVRGQRLCLFPASSGERAGRAAAARPRYQPAGSDIS